MKRALLLILSMAVFISCTLIPNASELDKYNPANALDEEGGIWSFYIVNKDKDDMSNFPKAARTATTNGTVQFNGSSTPFNASNTEYLRWTEAEKKEGIVFVHPHIAKVGILFTPKHAGNYKFSLNIRNIGNGVYTGDGGSATLGILEPQSEWNVSCFERLKIPVSAPDVMTASTSGNAALKEGQSVMLWLYPGSDGNGDGFEIKYNIEETNEQGTEYEYNGLEGLLVQIPSKVTFEPAPYREGLLWIGSAPNGSDKQRLEEVYSLWSKYFPNRVAAVSAAGLGQFGDFEFFAKRNVPVLYQYSVGTDLYKYLDYMGAFEVAWDEVTEDSGQTQHPGAIPHESYIHAFEQAINAGMAAGGSGYGHSDYIWNYWLGRGRAGYNPQTIAAFRRALQGLDEGLRITLDGGPARVIHFWDYAKHYLGREIMPEEQGYSSWEEYKPLTEAEYLEDTKKDYTPRYILFDLLVHYEWLLGAQRFGKVSTDEWGRITQILPNTEDMANGHDMLYLGGLENITMITDEYFKNTTFLDKSYYTVPSMIRNAGNGKSVGVVLEGGTGGNAHTYYDDGIAYATAYELTAAGWATHMELDWWHGQFSWETLTENERYREHLQTLMSYGRGYMDGMADQTSALEPDFISVYSRSMTRPWGSDYDTSKADLRRIWSAPSTVLAKKGFVYRSIGEDSVYEYLNQPQKVLSYAPDRPMRYHFDGVLERIKSGLIENTIMPAVSVRAIVDNDFHLKNMAEVYPEFAGKAEKASLNGSLKGADGSVLTEKININTELYSITDSRWKTALSVGGTPVVLESYYGSGKIWLVLFDPNTSQNYELSGAVYTYILEQNGIKRHWETIENSGELTGNNKITEGGAYNSMGALESEASVRLYKNGDGMTVAGVQNSMGRYLATNSQRQGGTNIPYEFSGVTRVKVLLDEPNKRYDYAVMPSGIRGSGQTDSEGFLELCFEDTTHEIFYIYPSSAENMNKLSKILERKQILNDAISLDGRISINTK